MFIDTHTRGLRVFRAEERVFAEIIVLCACAASCSGKRRRVFFGRARERARATESTTGLDFVGWLALVVFCGRGGDGADERDRDPYLDRSRSTAAPPLPPVVSGTRRHRDLRRQQPVRTRTYSDRIIYRFYTPLTRPRQITRCYCPCVFEICCRERGTCSAAVVP